MAERETESSTSSVAVNIFQDVPPQLPGNITAEMEIEKRGGGGGKVGGIVQGGGPHSANQATEMKLIITLVKLRIKNCLLNLLCSQTLQAAS